MIVGFIKSPIQEINVPYDRLNQGVISDCDNYKLEIRMQDLSNMEEYRTRVNVRIVGTIKFRHNTLSIGDKKTGDIIGIKSK